jgi:putative transposase
MFNFRQIAHILRLLLTPRTAIVIEDIALRHQISVLSRHSKRPRLSPLDRIFWVWLSKIWAGWRTSLVIVKPDTVVGWHRQGWRLYWRWKSRCRAGRPQVDRETRKLVRRMARENPLWGAPRIHGEMLKLGFEVAESTVGKYMPKRAKPPSVTWRAFLMNHGLVACDFLTVPTMTFGILYVFVVLRHCDRWLLHVRVTSYPAAAWTAQQIREAFPFDEVPKYLLRDNDSIYGAEFSRAVANVGIEEARTAKGSPWQNPFVERVVGSIRRECVDHIIPMNRRHLQQALDSYRDYYNASRRHLGLGKDSPESREIEPRERGAEIIAIPEVGGLHHRYTRKAA